VCIEENGGGSQAHFRTTDTAVCRGGFVPRVTIRISHPASRNRRKTVVSVIAGPPWATLRASVIEFLPLARSQREPRVSRIAKSPEPSNSIAASARFGSDATAATSGRTHDALSDCSRRSPVGTRSTCATGNGGTMHPDTIVIVYSSMT